MTVTPMVSELLTTGAASTARIQVGNDTSAPLPFEAKVVKITWHEDGSRTESPADDDFLVFPPQGLIGAGSHQVVRVQWLGDPQTKGSEAFYLEIKQLPIQIDAKADPNQRPIAKIQMIYDIKALMVVAPRGAKSSVRVLSAEAATIEGKPPEGASPNAKPIPPSPAVKVVLENDGARHALMGGVTWIFEGNGLDGKPQRLLVKPSAALAAIGVGYLPPQGGRRVLTVSVDKAFGRGPIKVSFTE
jgi:fimbrial chaperone protein